jgi:hypothetical protein
LDGIAGLIDSLKMEHTGRLKAHVVAFGRFHRAGALTNTECGQLQLGARR